MDEATLAEFKRQQMVAAKIELTRRIQEESENTKLNSLKIQNQWRKIMRLAKTEALKKDVEILSQNHERDVDRKDAILQMLDRDLEESEDQYQMALRSHLMNVDNLIKLHDSRLYSLERNFQSELKTLQDDFNKEKAFLSTKFTQERNDLQSIIDHVEAEEEEKENEAKHAYEQLREEIRNRNLEDINMLRISLDAQIEELEQHFESAHLNYLQQTAQRTHDFKELTQNDQSLSQDIDQKRKAIDSLQNNIQHWRAKIRHLNRETEERNRLLLDEKHSIQKHYQQLKQRIQIYRGTQNQRLLHLSQCANSCKTSLQEKLTVAKNVLQLGELSRKMETSEELILPFSSLESDAQHVASSENKHSEATINEFEGNDDLLNNDNATGTGSHARKSIKDSFVPLAHQSSVWSDENKCIAPTDRLSLFYRKFNKILLDNIAIDKERQRLVQENGQLEDLIKQFVDGTKLGDATLSDDNPLFVVNGRANLNYSAPPSERRPTVQEGNQIASFANRQHGVRR